MFKKAILIRNRILAVVTVDEDPGCSQTAAVIVSDEISGHGFYRQIPTLSSFSYSNVSVLFSHGYVVATENQPDCDQQHGD